MKIIGGLLKFVAVIFMFAVVVTLPATLLARNIGEVMFSPEIVLVVVPEG